MASTCRLLEPQRGKRYNGSLLARAELDLPEGQAIERAELSSTTLASPPSSIPLGGLHEEEPLQARDAALGFLRRTIRPKDSAAVVTSTTTQTWPPN